MEDGRVVDVGSVVWATGFAWVSLPVFDSDGYPAHHRGVVESEPGLYFVGLRFLYTLTSSFIGGVGADAGYIARHIAARPIENGMLNEDDRVRVGHGGSEKTQGIVRGRRSDDPESRHSCVPRFEALGVRRTELATSPGNRSDHQWDRHLASGHVADLGSHVHDLVHRHQ